MNKILLGIIIIAFILATIIAATIKPVLYKQVVFAPQNVEVKNTEPQFVETELRTQQLKAIDEGAESIKVIKTTAQSSERIIKQNKQIQNEEEKVQQPKLPNSVQEIIKPKIKELRQEKEIQTVIPAKPEEKKEEIIQAEQKQISVIPKQLTEQEEVILWNKWRSSLQNKIMNDVQIQAPMGTRFRFSFTVDRYGQVSNLKVWSDNPEYTSEAVKKIKPAIASYQGQPILNFPIGTQRIVVNVTGAFALAPVTRYSKPQDYSDIETVKYTR